MSIINDNDIQPIIENTLFIDKDNILENILNKIIKFNELNMKKINKNKELNFSYIVYTKFNKSITKINKLINTLIREKYNNNICVNLIGDILSSTKGLMQTVNGFKILHVEKIKFRISIINKNYYHF